MEYDSALELLKKLFAESDTGSGQMVLIEGGLASGKTYLLHDFGRYAAESGAIVLRATGSQAERDLQMGVIDQLFRNSGTAALFSDKSVNTAVGSILDRVGALAQTLTSQSADPVLTQELCGVLLELCQERPLVVMVDDIHFADGSSLRVLLSLQRRMDAARLLLVFNEWARGQPTLPLFHAELTRHPHHRLRLAPLTVAAISELITKTLGSRNAEALAAGYHTLTSGNPMLVEALLEDQCGSGSDVSEPVVGVAYAQAVLACLHRWEPQLLEVAQAAAVLGTWSSSTMISRLLRSRQEPVDDVVAILTDAGMLEDGRFRHPLAEVAVLESMSAAGRPSIHLQAAYLLHQHGASSADVAEHLLEAGRVEAAWARSVLRDAAGQALADGDIATAVRCLELALESCEDNRERLPIVHALTRALWGLNPSAAVPYLMELQTAVQDGELTGRNAVTVVRYSLWRGDLEAALKAINALSNASELIDAQSVAELSVASCWYFGRVRDQLRDLGLQVPSSKDLFADATNRLATLWTRDAPGGASVSAQHILQSCRLDETSIEVVAMSILALMRDGKLEMARLWCDRLLAEASRRDETTWRAVLKTISAGLYLRRGDLVTARQRGESAIDLLPAQAWGVFIGAPRATLIRTYTALDDLDSAFDLLRQRVPDEMFTTVFGLSYLHARGHYFLAADQALAASRDFLTCSKLMRDWEIDVPALLPWRSDLAEANLQLGRISEARELVKQQLDRTRGLDARTKGISLRVLASCTEMSQRPTLLRQSVEYLRAADDRLELSRALSDFSHVYQELGEFERARGLARQAGQVTQTAASALPVAKNPGRRRATGERAAAAQQAEESSHPMLSDAELRVAELAALGHTNREISSTLFITVSTVEQHLTRIYRKLGVTKRSALRTELVAAKAREGIQRYGNGIAG